MMQDKQFDNLRIYFLSLEFFIYINDLSESLQSDFTVICSVFYSVRLKYGDSFQLSRRGEYYSWILYNRKPSDGSRK